MKEKNWKTFIIVGKSHWVYHADTIYFDLDDWFYFAEKNRYKMIWCANQEPFNGWKIGDTIELDLNWLKTQTVGQDSCLIESREVARLVGRHEHSRTSLVSSFSSPPPQVPTFSLSNLPSVSDVVSGRYRWDTEATNLHSNQEEFQTLTMQQNQNYNVNGRVYPPKWK